MVAHVITVNSLPAICSFVHSFCELLFCAFRPAEGSSAAAGDSHTLQRKQKLITKRNRASNAYSSFLIDILITVVATGTTINSLFESLNFQAATSHFFFIIYGVSFIIAHYFFCGRTVWIEWFLFMDRENKRKQKLELQKLNCSGFMSFRFNGSRKAENNTKNGNLCTFTHQFLLLYYFISLLFFGSTCLAIELDGSLAQVCVAAHWNCLVGNREMCYQQMVVSLVFFLFFSCFLFMFGGRKHW